MDPPNSGRRRAALRVKQRRKQEQRRWSPSGKRGKRSASSRQQNQTKLEQRKEWNDRFMFDEQSLKGQTNALGVTSNGVRTRRRSIEGKENNANTKEEGGLKTRQYTERADGEAIVQFTRCELSPSAPVKVDTNDSCHDLIGRRSVGVSPFDMDKVRAALEVDEEATGDSEEPCENMLLRPLQEPRESEAWSKNHEREASRTKIPPPSQCKALHPIHLQGGLNTKAILDQMEELLLTTALEEELLRRDMARIPTHDIETTDSEKHELTACDVRHSEGSLTFAAVDQATLPKERHDAILDYIESNRRFRNQSEEQLAKNGYLQYHEIVEVLAEDLLSQCIKSIAEELEHSVKMCSEHIFRQL